MVELEDELKMVELKEQPLEEGGEEMQKVTSNGNAGRRSSAASNGMPAPPDGGWGWMVVFGSFIIHIIADGVVYSFGIFFIEFLEYFKSGKGETAWLGSLVPGVTLTVGPLASILTNKYGCRVTTIVGSIIATSGFVLSIFAPNLYFLYFSFGIMSGVGFGLMYLPAIVSVGFYFENKRAFATGLAVCGSGLGAFIFNPLSKYLIEEFGWRGAVLIEAGIILNCVLCGALFRSLENPKVLKQKKSEATLVAPVKDSSLVKDHAEVSEHLLVSHSNGIPKINGHGDQGDSCIFANQFHTSSNDAFSLVDSDGARRSSLKKIPQSHSASPMHPRDIHLHDFTSGSLMNISIHRSHPALYITSITSIHAAETDIQKKICCCSVREEIYDTLKEMCDLSLLKNVIFLVFVISNFCTSIGFNMPFIFLYDFAVEEGVSKEEAQWLVSAIGITNTFSRVAFGFIADKQFVNRLTLYNTSLTICGVATALCPLCFNYGLLILYACAFGLFIGVYVSLTSVVLVDLLGIDMLTHSFGLLLLFQGIATLIGPPIAGWIYDGTGSYDISFIVAGVVVAFSGVMLYLIPVINKCMKHRSKNNVRE